MKNHNIRNIIIFFIIVFGIFFLMSEMVDKKDKEGITPSIVEEKTDEKTDEKLKKKSNEKEEKKNINKDVNKTNKIEEVKDTDKDRGKIEDIKENSDGKPTEEKNIDIDKEEPAEEVEEKETEIPEKKVEIEEEKDTQSKKNKEVKDMYQTDPIPEGKPKPVEPEDASIEDKSFMVTLSVSCETILDNMDKLKEEKVELVPDDGIIFPATEVIVYEGESVFNILHREMKTNKIHMEFVNTPIYNSAYIEGISNLYEFDCGDLSGWMYKVNGWFPNYGVSRYKLEEGDIVEFVYTCDLGRDVGNEYLSE